MIGWPGCGARTWLTWAARSISRICSNALSSRTGPSPSRVVVRDLGFRWGSCGRNGALYVNWRVMQLPVGVVDYVLLHELCHLLEQSHRLEFWRILERALPDWRERKEELHRRAADIYWCAPEMVQ